MMYNKLGQPIGVTIDNHSPGPCPSIDRIEGREIRVEKVNRSHFEDLLLLYTKEAGDEQFTYMTFERFEDNQGFQEFFQSLCDSKDPYYLTIVDQKTNKALGVFALMRMDRNNRVVEMGSVFYGPTLQRSKGATEAQYLMMCYVFDVLHYRRYEWKCDALNAPSKRAAERLGFTYEGTFRQAMVYKGRNRDTAWYAITDQEWPRQNQRFKAWLDDRNFDNNGHQITSLKYL